MMMMMEGAAAIPRDAGPRDENAKEEFWNAIDRVDSLENWIDGRIESSMREYTFLRSELSFRHKTLRLIVRYQFIPGSVDVRSHYIVVIDGMVLDPRRQTGKTVNFYRHLQWLRIQVLERRPGADPQTVEWSESTFPEGSSTSTIVTRIYAEKNCAIRISFALSEDHISIAKYEIPESLRRNLNLPPILTIDEACLAVMGYAHRQNLFSKDRKYIVVDEAFGEVFSMEPKSILSLPQVRHRIMVQLSGSHVPPAAVSFDMTMTPNSIEDANLPILQLLNSSTSTSLSGTANGVYSSQGGKTLKDIVLKSGGKVSSCLYSSLCSLLTP